MDENNLPNPNATADSGIANENLDVLFNATPEEIDTLVNTRTINPAQGQYIKENQSSAKIRAAQEAEQNATIEQQAIAQPGQFMQDTQQGMDTVENAAMKGTGIAPGLQPLGGAAPSPLGPQAQGLPSTLQAPVEEIQAQEMAKATRQEAAIGAQEAAQTQRAAKTVEREQQANMDVAATESKVAADIKKDHSDLWRNIGDAVSIMLGAYSQGLTGNKENPGLKAVEARLEREIANRKYNSEQEAALRKLAVDAANLRLEQLKTLTDNKYKIAQIEKLQAETSKLGQEAVGVQKMNALLRNKSLTKAEVGELQLGGKESAELANMYVPVPGEPDKFVRPIGTSEQITKLKTFNNDVGTIVPEIDDIIRVAESADFNKLNPADRMVMQTKLSSLVGKLRIPFTGPGILTDNEREMLFKTLGNPNTIFSIPSWELSKLREVRRAIKGGVANAYKNLGGIELPNPQYDSMKLKALEKGFSQDTLDQAAKNLKARRK